jgi:hypothetical protein
MSHPYQLENGGNHLKIQFPDTSYGLTCKQDFLRIAGKKTVAAEDILLPY